jgi:ribonuclease P protein component
VLVDDDDLTASRIAYAIGRPVGGAVVRNQLRRRLRHAVAAHAEAWRPGWYLIGARPAAATRSYQELDAMLQQLLNRIAREHR